MIIVQHKININIVINLFIINNLNLFVNVLVKKIKKGLYSRGWILHKSWVIDLDRKLNLSLSGF